MSLSRRRFLTLSGVAMAAAASGRFARGCEPVPEPADVANGMNAFACELYSKLSGESGNLAFSPASLSTALAMTSAGARGNTLTEMNAVLHLPNDPHPKYGEFLGRVFAHGRDIKRPYDLTAANAIWAQRGYPWRDEFTTLVNKNYLAGVVETNFAQPEPARKAINDWVEKQTHERIKDLIPAGVITVLTRMVLTNAVYFKGDWASPFKEAATKDQPFHLDTGEKATVPMMSQTDDFRFAEVEYEADSRARDTVQILSLPYAGNDLSMDLLLPKREKLSVLEGRLTARRLTEWTKHLATGKVRVQIPRFKLAPRDSLRLTAPLQELGMKDAFDDRKADFSGLHSGKEALCITDVVHKAFVEVNEKGTEAAAGTGVVIGLRGAPREQVFRADKPFLFMIRENRTGGILFLGRVANPKV